MVRVGTPSAVARPAWYDRNPIHRQNVYDAYGVVPHNLSVRWTYTVPAGKKAFVEALQINVTRVTAATTPGWVRAQISIIPSGGSSGNLFVVDLFTNNVGDREVVSVSQGATLLAGDLIGGSTQDLSTGGTVSYLLSAKITEFDA